MLDEAAVLAGSARTPAEDSSLPSARPADHGSPERRDRLLADALAFAGLLVAGLKLIWGLSDGLDVGVSDEDSYLHNGVTLRAHGLGNPVEAPLYQLWYFAPSFLLPTTLDLYYFSFRVLTVAPFLLLYMFLRRVSIPIHVAFVVSWMLLVSRVNVNHDTRVSHFALIIILLTFFAVMSARSLLGAMLLASLGGLVTAYVRPEYFLVAGTSFFPLLVPHLRPSLQRRDLRRVVGHAVCAAILLGVFGVPMGGGRGLVAFGDGFAMNWIGWTGSDLHPFTDSEDIVRQNFGPVTGVLGALQAKPALFARHIAANLRETVSGITLMKMFPPFCPGDYLTKATMGLSIAAVVVAYRGNLRRNLQHHGARLAILGWFVVPGLLSAVIVTPKEHYLLPLGVIVAALITMLLAPPEHGTAGGRGWLALGFLLLAVTPSLVMLEPVGPSGTKRPNVETIHFIESLHIRGMVNLLDAGGDFNVYLGDNFHPVPRWENKKGFDRFRSERNVNMIVWSRSLDRDSRFRADREWRYFLEHYGDFGWIVRDIPGTDKKIFVRTDLMPRERG